MIYGAIYQLSTGMITVFANGPDEDFLHLQCQGNPDLGVYVGQIDMKTHYLPGGVPTERPLMPLEIKLNGSPAPDPLIMTTADVLEITGIPEGCAVFHPAGRDIVDDGFIEWGAEQAMETTFMFYCAPFQEVTLHAKVG